MLDELKKKSFISRFHQPAKQWIKIGILTLVYVTFIIWHGNFAWLLLLPLFFDMFITRFIPWDWWQRIENKLLRQVCSLLDAIVFALLVVYPIHNYIFQPYQIPSSSLEKTLLVGDFLVVSKLSYGARVPNTPLSMPLVQNTFPWGGKSYFENPQWKYRRLKGRDSVEHGDIVVFNFPAGDTTFTKVVNPDYYTLCYIAGHEIIARNPTEYGHLSPTDSTFRDYFALCRRLGRLAVRERADSLGKALWRPVDRRECYVKRCVGLPGDTLKIVDNILFVNGKPERRYDGLQHNYYVQTDGMPIGETMLKKLNVRKDDARLNFMMHPFYLELMGMQPNISVSLMPLTDKTKQQLESFPMIKKVVCETALEQPSASGLQNVWPLDGNYGWTRDNYGPIVVPKRGETVRLTLENLPVYEQVIVNYERNTLRVVGKNIYINDLLTDVYTFGMDYFWMMGDNRHQSADSRYWGFVPEDHVIGRPLFVWLSIDKDRGWFDGRLRWRRFGRDASK
ncbi:MAG: S26 family signal peptidase [Prevotellaceae bacterium]|jgi:signal peptidase I|nr:S26 family signal peptidase [Prevotellaceae bacterium]